MLLGLGAVAQSRYLETAASRTTLTTATSNSDPDGIPRVTDAPSVEKRAESISPNICGWYEDSGFDVGWSNAEQPSHTCFWNSDEHLVGSEFPLPTVCHEHTTAGDDTTLKCDDDYPYCLTFLYGNDYSAFLCHSESDVTWTMAPTWSDMDTPIAFPIYSGSNGISTGTQYPSGYEGPTTNTATTTDADDSSASQTDSSPSSSDSSDSPSESGTSSGSTTSTNPTTTSTPEDPAPSSPTPVGAIVGGVVGGLAVIAIAACVIVYLRRRKDQSTPPAAQEHLPPKFVPGYRPADEKPRPTPQPATGDEPRSNPVPALQSQEEETPSPPYPSQELWARCAGPDSTQNNAPLAGGRQIYEAP
ncbi:hypothetical protein FQN54_006710 [Arachnomyces sp. PD_36]|nr:hypothetical protein FQN54_006710 [Arachnomyces sp. PD_36]